MPKGGIHHRTQTINGIVYVYEDHPYWNSKKQQTRHKRVFIGKKDSEGNFILNKKYLNRLNMHRPNVQSEESLEGKVFVRLVALMLISWLHKHMKARR